MLNNTDENRLPLRQAEVPLNANFNTTEEYIINEQFVIFDRETRVPIDTITVDSVQLILYTGGGKR